MISQSNIVIQNPAIFRRNHQSPIKVFDPVHRIIFYPKETYFISMLLFVNVKFSVRYDLNNRNKFKTAIPHYITQMMILTCSILSKLRFAKSLVRVTSQMC